MNNRAFAFLYLNRAKEEKFNQWDFTRFCACFFLFLVLFFFNFSSCKAEEKDAINKSNVSVMTIDDCIKYAIKNNPTIKIYIQKQLAQKSILGEQKSSYFPSLTGGTGYNINNRNNTGNNINANSNNNYYALSAGINQLIWDFGRTNARINMQKYNYEATGYDLDYQIIDSVYAVKVAYASVLAARANEDIYNRSVSINQLNYDRTKALFQEGLKSRIDVVNAQVYLTNAKIDLLAAQNSYQTALITLNNSMYYLDAPSYEIKPLESFNLQKDYSTKNEIAVASFKKLKEAKLSEGAILTSGIEKQDIIQDFTFSPYGLSFQDSVNKAYANRPDLKSLELVVNAAEESLNAVRKAYAPSVNASLGYSFQKNNNYSTRNLGVYAGIDLPTINAMGIKNQIEEATSYVGIAKENVDLSKKNIYFEVQNYYVNMKLLEKRIPLMSQKVAQTLENFELADGRYTVGLGNFIELQEAQTNYNNAQLAFVESIYNYNKARFYLERSMGFKNISDDSVVDVRNSVSNSLKEIGKSKLKFKFSKRQK